MTDAAGSGAAGSGRWISLLAAAGATAGMIVVGPVGAQSQQGGTTAPSGGSVLACQPHQDCWSEGPSLKRGLRRPIVMGTEEGRRDIEERRTRGLLQSIEREIFFDYNSADIAPTARAALDRIGADLMALPPDQRHNNKFTIAGHTDAKGSEEYNQSLSERRAQAVASYLSRTYSISLDRLDAYGRGKSQLKMPGEPFAPSNRRVEITNLGPNAVRPPETSQAPVYNRQPPPSQPPSAPPAAAPQSPAPVAPSQPAGECTRFEPVSGRTIVVPC